MTLPQQLPGPNADFWDWQLHGACRGEASEIFYHPEGERGRARTRVRIERRLFASTARCLPSAASMPCVWPSPMASGAA